MSKHINPTDFDELTDYLGQVDRALSGTTSRTFSSMVRSTGLDPKLDLKGFSWRGIDFTNEDLRDYDFSNCDLRGCKFKNSLILGATFDGAQLDVSQLRKSKDFRDWRGRNPIAAALTREFYSLLARAFAGRQVAGGAYNTGGLEVSHDLGGSRIGDFLKDAFAGRENKLKKINPKENKVRYFSKYKNTNLVGKRVFDVVLASILLLAFLPLFLIFSAIIRLGSKGPAIFRSQRVGMNGKLFNRYEFRSMKVRVETADLEQSFDHDARITGVGRFMRHTTLRNLPQLINVLRGDFSFVGPEAHTVQLHRWFQQEFGDELELIYSGTRPGLVGLRTADGPRKPNEVEDIKKSFKRDLEYVLTRSFWGDVKILIGAIVLEALCAFGLGASKVRR